MKCAENDGSGAKNCNVSKSGNLCEVNYGRKIKNSKQADKYKSTENIVKMNAVSTTVKLWELGDIMLTRPR